MITLPHSDLIELEKMDRMLGIVVKHNISKLKIGDVEVENTRPPQSVVQSVQEAHKQLTEDELLFDPMKGL